ncbi:MAG: hypothetical protein ACLFNX_12260, partial [Spirochaetaceae bacterium]
MSAHDSEYNRTLLKTRWTNLDRGQTDHGRGKPMPPMQKPCAGPTIALPDPSAAVTAGVSVRSSDGRSTPRRAKNTRGL